MLLIACLFSSPVFAMAIKSQFFSNNGLQVEIVNCRAEEGWCSANSSITISAVNDDATVRSIDVILNGQPLHFDGQKCEIPLQVGMNQLIYWGNQSSGTTTARQSITIKLVSGNNFLSVFHLIKAEEDSLPGGRTLLLNDTPAGVVLTSSQNPMPIRPLNSLSEKDFSRAISYIFKSILKRSPRNSQNSAVAFEPPVLMELALDSTPPLLSIHPQSSYFGKLTFSGVTEDEISGLKSVMVKINKDWQTVPFSNETWKYTWDSEKAGISGANLEFQVQAEDLAGNRTHQSLQFMVLNRIWPITTLCAFLLALGLNALFDPRRRAWKELSLMMQRAVLVSRINPHEEDV